jgi:hypothetical protein
MDNIIVAIEDRMNFKETIALLKKLGMIVEKVQPFLGSCSGYIRAKDTLKDIKGIIVSSPHRCSCC